MNKEKRRQAWMASFEDHVLRLDEKHRGRIEWQTAEYFCNSNMSAMDAAEKYVETRKDD